MNEKHIEVLQQYDLEVLSVRRGRGAWICETSQGLMLLKEYKGTVKRLEFEDQVLGYVQDSGCQYVDRYVRNREGALISIADDGTKYLVKKWYDDQECNIKDRQEIMSAISQIARLHKVLRQIEFQDEWNMGSIVVPSPELEMERHNRELKRARTYIRSKRKKSDFELCVIGNYNLFYQQAEKAREGLSLLQENSEKSLFLCHGELNQHHILMGRDYIAITEFNRMHLGMQMSDLYHFMRKVMEKHDWDMALGLDMLNSYDRMLSISHEDRKRLYYLFLYPEKYWKQINFYFNANKAWIPARNIEKLRGLERQQESREKFLSKIK